MMARSLVAMLVAGVLGSACSSTPPPSVTPPGVPADNDPAYMIEFGGWALVGDGLTPAQNTVHVRVVGPADYVDAWVAGGAGVRLEKADGGFEGNLDVSGLELGEYELLLGADGAATAFAKLTVRRSNALYVLVSNDWDDANNTDEVLRLQEALHAEHPELKMTHFVGPYTFTDPDVTTERRQLLTDWVKKMRDDEGDEIGLHIHPYCNFVNTTSVTCRTTPSSVQRFGDQTGYSVMLNAYTEEELGTLFEASDTLFEANGLGKPTSFRAGGWIADLKVLRALSAAGHVADSSANNWARMEEWEGYPLYDWNQEHWATINDTTQPWYPSENDILAADAPTLSILEVPDNGILVDYVTADEMIEIFDANWDGNVLPGPVAYSVGYHPSNFNDEYKLRITTALNHVDKFLASSGTGPVVYTTLSDTVKVWTRD